MSERAILKGRLAELTGRLADDAIRAKSLCERIGVCVNPLIQEDWAEMPVAEAAALMDDLIILHGEMLATSTQLEAIKKELYD